MIIYLFILAIFIVLLLRHPNAPPLKATSGLKASRLRTGYRVALPRHLPKIEASPDVLPGSRSGILAFLEVGKL